MVCYQAEQRRRKIEIPDVAEIPNFGAKCEAKF